MTIETALITMNNVAKAYVGNLKDHQDIQTALQTITEALRAPTPKKEVKNRKAK